MAPVVHGLENKYKENMDFSYLDIDDPNTIRLQNDMNYEYRWRPFIFLVSSTGEVSEVFIGVTPGDTLEQAIINLLMAEGAAGG